MSGFRANAVVIGGSAGALDALSTILTQLPADYPIPIMVVVHIPPHKDSLLASILNMKCKMDVHEAEDKEPLKAGTIYIAPPDYHLLVEKGGTLALSSDEEILFSRPSIDALFESAADAYGDSLMGIVLTGANEDGASGALAIAEGGGMVLIQNPATANASAMPLAAIKLCPRARVMDLPQISEFLMNNTLANAR
jgi:two-component system, chemotaxis family, protein-glutamate methylesterase/glutaminase